METYRGSCHCGSVTFTIRTDPTYSVRCDCSICRRHGAIMVRCDRNDLEIHTGRDSLVEYQFNTRVAIHYFCGECGIYTFHKMRKLPDKYGVNAGCLDDLPALQPIFIEGSKA